MKRLLNLIVAALWFICIAAGSATPRQPTKSITRYLVGIPLVQLQRWGLRPQEVVGNMGTLVLDKKAMFQLQLAGLRVKVKEIAEIPLPEPFLSPQEIDAELKQLAARYADRAELVDLNQRFKTALTVEGRSLKALRIRYPIKDTSPRPVVVLDSLHHARELITPLVTMDAARQLLSQFQKNSEVTAWLKHYEIWIVPVVNPDGYQFVFTKEPYWRKNRRPNPDGSFGVDLNRNYPYLWGFCGKHSAMPRSEVFKGLAAASEPETQTMVAMGDALRPSLYLSYHSYGDEIIRPYVCKKAGEENLLQSVTQELATASGYAYRKASSSGESFEHYYALYGALSFLVEVGRQFHPEVERIPGLVASARKSWQALLARGMKSALQVTVTNEAKEPVVAELKLDEISFSAGELRRTHPKHGSFYWVLSAGEYTLRVVAPGYLPWQKKVAIPTNSPLSLSIVLERQREVPSGEKMRSEEKPLRSELVPDGADRSDSVGTDSARDAEPIVTPERPGSSELTSNEPTTPDRPVNEAKVPPVSSCQCAAGRLPTTGFAWIFLWIFCLISLVKRHMRLMREESTDSTPFE